jgi:hypothetical protein
MNNNLYSINVYDDIVSNSTQLEVAKYLEEQTWHMQWMPMPALPKKLNRFKPKDGLNGPLATWPIVQSSTFARCCLARDEEHLKSKHSLIWNLWQEINAGLNNEYEITGYPEDMFDEEYSAENGIDGWGWRVYVNALYGRITTGTWGPHRDTPDLDDESSVTILYFVNPEWYPRWSGEIIFYPEDPDGLTGDQQQFNIGEHQQHRNYSVGWPDQGRIVSPVPNRVVVFDGRCLHNCHAPSTPDGARSKPLSRIVFRARKKVK